MESNMEENAQIPKTGKRKRFFIAAGCIIIVVILILSGIYFIYFDDINEIDMRITLDGVPWTGYGFNVSCILKNLDSKAITIVEPELGKNFDILIYTPDETNIQFSGPVNTGIPIHITLQPNEIYMIKISVIQTSYWMNYNFPVGKYKVWADYTVDVNDAISGWKKSNVIEFEIE